MDRLTVDYGKKFSPFRYAMKDGSDAEIGYFKNYDAFYSHMLIVQKLGEYEDLEEQGLLLRLPCKVGDTVYRINNGARKPIIPLYVVEIRFKQVGSYIREKICCSDDSMTNTASSIYYKEDIGNRIFLSKAEAEQKLKEMGSK